MKGILQPKFGNSYVFVFSFTVVFLYRVGSLVFTKAHFQILKEIILKGVLNPNFRLFSFELNKKCIF